MAEPYGRDLETKSDITESNHVQIRVTLGDRNILVKMKTHDRLKRVFGTFVKQAQLSTFETKIIAFTYHGIILTKNQTPNTYSIAENDSIHVDIAPPQILKRKLNLGGKAYRRAVKLHGERLLRDQRVSQHQRYFVHVPLVSLPSQMDIQKTAVQLQQDDAMVLD